MLAIDAEEVRRIAELARIDLDEESIALFSQQFQKILGYVAMLDDVEIAAVPPQIGPSPRGTAARPDVAIDSLTPAEALHNSPESGAGMFRVPQVLRTK